MKTRQHLYALETLIVMFGSITAGIFLGYITDKLGITSTIISMAVFSSYLTIFSYIRWKHIAQLREHYNMEVETLVL